MRIIFTMLLLSLPVWLRAQTGSLLLKAEGGATLLLTLNGQVINSEAAASVQANSLASGPQKANLTLRQSSGAVVADILNINASDGFRMEYVVSADAAGQLSVRLLDKVDLGTAPAAAAPAAAPAAQAPAAAAPAAAAPAAPAPTTGQKTKNFFNNLFKPGGATVATDNKGNAVRLDGNAYANQQIQNQSGQYVPGAPSTEPEAAKKETPDPEVRTMPCNGAMFAFDFQDLIKSMSGEAFDANKMELLKRTGNKECFDIEQIKQLMDQFTYESDKLFVAKYCYTRCSKLYDRPKYHELNERFKFPSSKTDLDQYIQRIG